MQVPRSLRFLGLTPNISIVQFNHQQNNLSSEFFQGRDRKSTCRTGQTFRSRSSMKLKAKKYYQMILNYQNLE